MKTKTGHFDPDKLEDTYEDALKELLKRTCAALRSVEIRFPG
jgi:non-homologous end joining protein Ku